MKRIISILSLIIGFGLWADTEKVGQYTWSYRIINGAAEICKDTFPSAISPAPTGHVSIPNMLGGKPVKAIQTDAFRNCIGLTSVTISSNVTRIGESAFSGCTSLASVTIPDSVTTIGASAFWGCNDALYDVTSIKYVQLVDGWAVGADPVLSNLFLTGVRGIADSAFRNCVGLKYVVIPYGVTDIGSLVFADCNQLEEVRLPNSVTQIGENAFRGVDTVYYDGYYEIHNKLFREGNAINLDKKLTVPLRPMKTLATYVGKNRSFDKVNGLCNIGPIVTINVDGNITESDWPMLADA